MISGEWPLDGMKPALAAAPATYAALYIMS